MTSASSPRRRWLVVLIAGLLAALLGALLVTSAEPWAPQRRTATAVQVEAARSAFQTVRSSRKTGRAAELRLSDDDLDGIATLVSQGFAPYRTDAGIERGTLHLTLSRPVLTRWLNVRAQANGRSEGFPAVRLSIGAIDLPPWLSRIGIGIARQLLVLRGADLPPLDSIVQSMSIGANSMRARVMLPRTGLIDQVAGEPTGALDETAVAAIYCRLAKQQQSAPEPLFERQLARALRETEADAGQDGAALIALAMLAVGPQVGELAGEVEDRVSACAIPAQPLTLHGRVDLAKHWSLSAALTVAAGGRFAVAMGEWKELADSLSGSALPDAKDRSGFSFVDLAADRAGFLTARLLTGDTPSDAMRRRLTAGLADAVLPPMVLELPEGLTNDEFVRSYGATDDPQFAAEVSRIDAMLAAGGIR